MVMCSLSNWEKEKELDEVDVLIVNGSDSILVGGSSENILRRCKEKKWKAYEIESNLVAHSSMITKEDRDVMDMIHQGLEWKADNDMTELLLSSQHASDIYSDRADFCATVERVKNTLGDSVAFVEVGVNNHRTRSLRNMNRFAVSTNTQSTQSSYMQLLSVAAQLRANQVRGVDTSLFEKKSPYKKNLRTRSVRCKLNRGGRTYDDDLLSDIAYQRESAQRYSGPLIWDFDDLLEYAEGDLAGVFNKCKTSKNHDWKIIDQNYKRRVRLPMMDYLLVSRVTHLNATPGVYEKGASIRTEFDVPKNFSLSAGGDVPWCVLVEAGQCDLMLISYLGVDFDMKSDRVYRLLNTTLTFYGVAVEGQTLVYDIKIDRYLMRPDGSVHMFFFQYDCFVDGKLLIEMRNGCAGFFTDEELANGKGIQRKQIKVKHPQGPPPYISPLSKSSYTEREMLYLCEQGKQRGWGEILPNATNFKYKLCTKKILMIDRITKVEPRGGDLGLGFIVGEKKLIADDWKFHSHFKDDPVLAGSLVSDGCSQLLRVFMIHSGLHLVHPREKSSKLLFRPVHGQANKVRCRGQISPPKIESTLRYEMSVVKTGLDDKNDPYVIANVDIVLVENGQEKIVVDFTGIALRLTSEENEIVGKRKITTNAATSVPKNWKQLTKMTWHPLSPKPSFVPGQFAPREIQFLPFPNNPNDNDHTPGKFPLTWFNMAEFMSGHISRCLGEDFKKFDYSKTSRSPAYDLALVTRVLSYDSKTQTSISEFDCPADAWFFKDNSSKMPHCILMEILLQNAGVLTSLERAPLKMKKKDLCFRNLDATATLTRLPDLKGKTITNVAKVTGFKLIRGNMAIHRFECSLSTKQDGVFYKCETSFGWFTPETMAQQIGLDGGRKIGLYHEREDLKLRKISSFSTQSRSRPNMLRLVDKRTVHVSENYIMGSCKLDPTAFFFKCHFVGDPVTPGSIGVEMAIELLEMYVVECGICVFEHEREREREKQLHTSLNKNIFHI